MGDIGYKRRGEKVCRRKDLSGNQSSSVQLCVQHCDMKRKTETQTETRLWPLTWSVLNRKRKDWAGKRGTIWQKILMKAGMGWDGMDGASLLDTVRSTSRRSVERESGRQRVCTVPSRISKSWQSYQMQMQMQLRRTRSPCHRARRGSQPLGLL
jgi:hypothetical protein